ncbi:hypothetical protein BDV41DRAFT_356868 [Aspergillus transmontanensis]|uniref:F-box domain-containing protein n=1 Tax=Aspergillus transmontanensis TaxID=1034304 RepID=A0A5N6VRZ7_9EURO|nr:hypothetical protein BDV41DRAFT_356868 [Aspergillus transmontanensis]
MSIFILPVEILYLIIDNLEISDLWVLYNSCRTLRACSAPFLFGAVEIRFDGTFATQLNSRFFPAAQGDLLPMLSEWSSHIKKLDLWGDEDSIQSEFFNLLDIVSNLRSVSISYPPNLSSFQQLLARLAVLPSLDTLQVDFMSPRTWTKSVTFHYLRKLQLSCIEHEPGLCELPLLPLLETLVLNFCCYCLECPRDGRGPCTMLRFSRLPQLQSLAISGAQRKNIICCGQATQLRRFEIAFSVGLELSSILSHLGTRLEVIHLSDSEFHVGETPLPSVTYPFLQRVSLVDAVSGLPTLCVAQLPSLTDFSMEIQPQDFEDLANWPRTFGFLQRTPVNLRLNSHGTTPCPQDQTGRLQQVAILPNVRLEGQDWSINSFKDLLMTRNSGYRPDSQTHAAHVTNNSLR